MKRFETYQNSVHSCLTSGWGLTGVAQYLGSRRVGVAPVSRARAVCVMVCVEQTCSTHDPTTQRFDDSTTYISHKRTVHRAATTARAPPPRPVAPVVPFMRHEHLEINLNKLFLSKYG